MRASHARDAAVRVAIAQGGVRAALSRPVGADPVTFAQTSVPIRDVITAAHRHQVHVTDEWARSANAQRIAAIELRAEPSRRAIRSRDTRGPAFVWRARIRHHRARAAAARLAATPSESASAAAREATDPRRRRAARIDARVGRRVQHDIARIAADRRETHDERGQHSAPHCGTVGVSEASGLALAAPCSKLTAKPASPTGRARGDSKNSAGAPLASFT